MNKAMLIIAAMLVFPVIASAQQPFSCTTPPAGGQCLISWTTATSTFGNATQAIDEGSGPHPPFSPGTCNGANNTCTGGLTGISTVNHPNGTTTRSVYVIIQPGGVHGAFKTNCNWIWHFGTRVREYQTTLTVTIP